MRQLQFIPKRLGENGNEGKGNYKANRLGDQGKFVIFSTTFLS